VNKMGSETSAHSQQEGRIRSGLHARRPGFHHPLTCLRMRRFHILLSFSMLVARRHVCPYHAGVVKIGLLGMWPMDTHAYTSEDQHVGAGMTSMLHAERRHAHAEDARMYAEQKLAGMRMLTCIDGAGTSQACACNMQTSTKPKRKYSKSMGLHARAGVLRSVGRAATRRHDAG